MGIGDIWNAFFLEPMLNALLVLYSVLGQNFALSIVAFTIIVRTLMLPLTLKQLSASKAMAKLQPQMEALKRKYPGKDQREELSRATMELYQKNGVNPLGCAVPTLIQFPIWIGLYWSITLAMADRPDNLYELGKHVYSAIPILPDLIPLNNSFLWLNLARPDPFYILAVLVAASTWVQQKMMTMPSSDPQQAQMNQMMGVMLPLMMGFFTISFPSGLALYWLVSNLYSIVVQYFVTGWGTLNVPASWRNWPGSGQPAVVLAGPPAPTTTRPAVARNTEPADGGVAAPRTTNGRKKTGKRSPSSARRA